MSSVDVVTLASGVRAMRDTSSGQIMHCGTGPAVESQALYVLPSRLSSRLCSPGKPQEEPLVLFDVGLGAASNALGAWRVSEALATAERRLEIVSFDHDLAPLRLAMQPEYAEAFGLHPDTDDGARVAVSALLEHGLHETARTTWRFVFGDFLTALASVTPESVDIVFWDMYSREVSPSLWGVTPFSALRRVCRKGASLHTYSAATSTRSALLLAGFAVGIGSATGNKGQTTIAAVDVCDLDAPLDGAWLKRLERSSAPFPSDVTDVANAWAQIRAMPQFAG
jgi:queuine tRNA-ribosyltransferase